jgi:hypothetical protein
VTTFCSLLPYEIQFSSVIPEVQYDERLELVMVSYFDTPKVLMLRVNKTTAYCYAGVGGKNCEYALLGMFSLQ